MAITREQLISLGFKPSKRSKTVNRKKYDTLIYNLNEFDYIFTGYNPFTDKIDFKRLWKTVRFEEDYHYIFPVEEMGELSFTVVKEFLKSEEEQYLNRGDI